MATSQWSCVARKLYGTNFQQTFERVSSMDFKFRNRWNQLQYIEDQPKKDRRKQKKEPSEHSVPILSFLKSSPGSFQSVSLSNQQKVHLFNPHHCTNQYRLANREKQISTVNYIYFTSLGFNEISSVRNFAQTNSQLVVYGPPGITALLHRMLKCCMATRIYERLIPDLVVHEPYEDCMVVYEQNLEIKIFKSVVKNMATCSYLVSAPRKEYKVSPQKLEKIGISEHACKTDLTTKMFLKEIMQGRQASHPQEGSMVKPVNVVNASFSNSFFLALNCPTPEHFAVLQKNECFPSHDVDMVAHWSPLSVCNSRHYQHWMQGLNDDCMHRFVKGEQDFDYSYPVQELYRKILNRVEPNLFPIYEKAQSFEEMIKRYENLADNGKESDMFMLQSPVTALPQESSSKLVLKACMMKNVNAKVKSEPAQWLNRSFPRLVVLGSGSSAFTSRRSNPAYLLRVSEKESVLFDCGSGTFGQLLHHFCKSNLADILSTIKVIFISHRHYDHFSGLTDFVEQIFSIHQTAKLVVMLPRYLQRLFSDSFQSRIQNQLTVYSNEDSSPIPKRHIARLLNVNSFQPVLVDHGVSTYGVVVEKRNGWKVVYSSDTLPMCEDLIRAGKGANLLIHDSLYIDNSFKSITEFKRHSVAEGAIATAAKMNAKNLLLTHFAPRHPIPVPIDMNNTGQFQGQVLYAIDHLEISFDTVRLFPATHEKLLEVFQDQVIDYSDWLTKGQIARESKNKEIVQSYNEAKMFME